MLCVENLKVFILGFISCIYFAICVCGGAFCLLFPLWYPSILCKWASNQWQFPTMQSSSLPESKWRRCSQRHVCCSCGFIVEDAFMSSMKTYVGCSPHLSHHGNFGNRCNFTRVVLINEILPWYLQAGLQMSGACIYPICNLDPLPLSK